MPTTEQINFARPWIGDVRCDRALSGNQDDLETIAGWMAGRERCGLPLSRPTAIRFAIEDGDYREEFTLAQMLDANADDEGLVEWLRSCELHDSFPTIGGLVSCIAAIGAR